MRTAPHILATNLLFSPVSFMNCQDRDPSAPEHTTGHMLAQTFHTVVFFTYLSVSLLDNCMSHRVRPPPRFDADKLHGDTSPWWTIQVMWQQHSSFRVESAPLYHSHTGEIPHPTRPSFQR